MKYVAGLLFSPTGKSVVLIRKNRPEWQAGKLNAVGGKIEFGETPFEAMVREFREETGVNRRDWQHIAILTGDGFEVNFFAAFGHDFFDVVTKTDEPVDIYIVREVLNDPSLMPNLKVMIALAKDDSGIVKPVHFKDCRK